MSDKSGREQSVTIRRKALPTWPEEFERLFDRIALATAIAAIGE